MSTPRCEHCGSGFEPSKPWARFCSSGCRVRAFRAAKRAVKAALKGPPVYFILDRHGRMATTEWFSYPKAAVGKMVNMIYRDGPTFRSPPIDRGLRVVKYSLVPAWQTDVLPYPSYSPPDMSGWKPSPK